MNSMLLAFATLDARLATECRLLSLRRHERAVRIGVHEFERHKPQRLWFDVDLCVRLQHAAAARDDIAHTLDYDFVREVIDQAVGNEGTKEDREVDFIALRLALARNESWVGPLHDSIKPKAKKVA